MKEPVDLGLVPGLRPHQEILPPVDSAPLQSPQVVQQPLLGDVVLAEDVGRAVLVGAGGEVVAVPSPLAGRHQLAEGGPRGPSGCGWQAAAGPYCPGGVHRGDVGRGEAAAGFRVVAAAAVGHL